MRTGKSKSDVPGPFRTDVGGGEKAGLNECTFGHEKRIRYLLLLAGGRSLYIHVVETGS